MKNLKDEYSRVRFRCEQDEVPSIFYIVTAYNPDGIVADAAKNLKANEQLCAELARLNFHNFRVTAGSPDFSHAEPSYAISCNRDEALGIAKHFQQEAIFEVIDGSVFLVSALNVKAIAKKIGSWSELLAKAKQPYLR